MFQKDLLARIQKLEAHRLEQVLQFERINQFQNDINLRITKGRPAGATEETQEAIVRALKRIETLEQQDLATTIALKGPDEVFAMNATQKQIDKLVERANEMN